MIPLALNNNFGMVLPVVYGIGTGLPVAIFAVGIALGITSMAHWFNKVAKLELYSRKITGIIFILVGVYYIWSYVIAVFRV